MKKLSKILLLITLLFNTGKLFAQEIVNKGDIIIHIKITSALINGKSSIDVYKHHNKAKIINAKMDSVEYTKSRKDTSYINMGKNWDTSDKKQLAKFQKIMDRYSVYDTTTAIVNLKKDIAYNKLLQLMAQTSKTELETSKIGQRITLDGFGFSCTIITENDTKKNFISTPIQESHPIVTEFLKGTEARLFKKDKLK
jgi:hypothetical protein